MGLDWNPGPKPKPGFEQEYRELFEKIEASSQFARPPRGRSFMKRIRDAFGIGLPSEEDRDAMVARVKEISTTAFETLNTPRVGFDAAADDWIRQRYAEQSPDMTEQEWVEQFKGFYVLDLVPLCDGLPRYTNGEAGGYVEAYAFRGQFLGECLDIIGEELLEDAYHSKLADDLRVYGEKLLKAAEDYASSKGIDLASIDVDRLFETADAAESGSADELDPAESDDFKLDVVRSAGRWCLFWAERGHMLEAYW